MMGEVLTFPVSSQTEAPATPVSPPTPCICIGFVGSGHYHVGVLWAPGSATFEVYDKALRYAERLSRQRGWSLVNLCTGSAA